MLIALIVIITIVSSDLIVAETSLSRVQRLFDDTFNAYLKNAHPHDELEPLSCTGKDTLGGYQLTMIDALDALAYIPPIEGDREERFRIAIDLVIGAQLNFDVDRNVSVFETTIRVLGGLVSSYLRAVENESQSARADTLLSMAIDLGQRLLPAFDTSTGIPYGTVNLRHGVPPNETAEVATSCAGTFYIEFGVLSRLTGDPKFEIAARNALIALYVRRGQNGLFGGHIDAQTGSWTNGDTGVGNYVDSTYETLLKAGIIFDDSELIAMFYTAFEAAQRNLLWKSWWARGHVAINDIIMFRVDSLAAFWPSLLTLIGQFSIAERLIDQLILVWSMFGLLPEEIDVQDDLKIVRAEYPLRPELAESCFYLFRATGDPRYVKCAEMILESLEASCVTPNHCGLAAISDVRTHQQANTMESFVLSETLKYLYLTLAPRDSLPSNCIFSTEGHLFDIDQLRRLQKYGSLDDLNFKPRYSAVMLSQVETDPSRIRFQLDKIATKLPEMTVSIEADLAHEPLLVGVNSDQVVGRALKSFEETVVSVLLSKYGDALNESSEQIYFLLLRSRHTRCPVPSRNFLRLFGQREMTFIDV